MRLPRLPRLPSGLMGPMDDRGLVLRASEAALLYELRGDGDRKRHRPEKDE